MDNYILCGMAFGDEGKGSFVDYLSQKARLFGMYNLIRYNGGSQASHTVTLANGIRHKFSQVSSGMFNTMNKTYLLDNMVINPFNLIVEIEELSRKLNCEVKDLLERIYLDDNCITVTRYHKLINKLDELKKGKESRSSVGTGVSTARYLYDEFGMSLKLKDIINGEQMIREKLQELQEHLIAFYNANEEQITINMIDSIKDVIEKELEFLTRPESVQQLTIEYMQLMSEHDFIIVHELQKVIDLKCANIFEGSQGLLIDRKYGIKPNTTLLDTSIEFARELTAEYDYKKVGIGKAFYSKHGKGVFPTEDAILNETFHDENQEIGNFNGNIRFGWFDSVLFRYAQMINATDETYLSCIDILTGMEEIKVCTHYEYNGVMDENFKATFEYSISREGKIIIRNIRENSDELTDYLKNCTPIYKVLSGWSQDVSRCKIFSDLPSECVRFIHYLEFITDTRISVVSVGPTAKQKILVW